MKFTLDTSDEVSTKEKAKVENEHTIAFWLTLNSSGVCLRAKKKGDRGYMHWWLLRIDFDGQLHLEADIPASLGLKVDKKGRLDGCCPYYNIIKEEK